jgi:hypothetical protein
MRRYWGPLAVLFLLVMLLVVASCGREEPRPAAPLPAPSASLDSTPSPSASPSAPRSASPSPVDDEDAVLATARAFAEVYTSSPSPSERAAWNRGIAKHSTPELAAMLRLTEVERLPDKFVLDVEAIDIGETVSSAVIVLDDDSVLILTLVTNGTSWKVSDVRAPE